MTDTPTVTNTLITFVDRANSFWSDVLVQITNADGSTYKETFQILKTQADSIKASNFTITQVINVFLRTNGGFHIP